MYVQPLCRSVPIEAGQLLRLYSRFLPAERAPACRWPARAAPPLAPPPAYIPAARRLPARACPPDEKIRDSDLPRARVSDSARAGRIDTRPPAGLRRPPAAARPTSDLIRFCGAPGLGDTISLQTHAHVTDTRTYISQIVSVIFDQML